MRSQIVPLIFALAESTYAQAPNVPLPRFEDYSVTEIFKSTPAAPQLVTPEERMFRTRIREGLMGPNFAGHYVVVQWECGSPCTMMVVVDARTGQIYRPPISEGETGNLRLVLPVLTFPVQGDPDRGSIHNSRIEFRQNSSLMIVKANPNPSKERDNYTHYYLWRNNRWTLLRRIRLEDLAP